MIYFFIAYAWRSKADDWNYYEDMTVNLHPIGWLLEARDEAKDGGEYKLLFWSEIPRAVYEAALGKLG